MHSGPRKKFMNTYFWKCYDLTQVLTFCGRVYYTFSFSHPIWCLQSDPLTVRTFSENHRFFSQLLFSFFLWTTAFVVWNPIILPPLNWTVRYGLSFTLFLSWKFSVTRFFQKPSPPRLRLTSLKIDFQLGVHILRKYRYAMRQYNTGTVHRRLRAVFFTALCRTVVKDC